MELLLILVLILLNGVFAMAEIAVVSARRSKLELEAEQGNSRARAALALAQEPNRLLSVVQVGITLIGVLTGIFSGAGVTTRLEAWLLTWPLTPPVAHGLAVGLTVTVITYVSVVVGELLPKRLALAAPEQLAKLLAGPMNAVASAGYPVVWVLEKSSDVLIRLLRVKPQADDAVTEDEIKAMVREGASEGTIREIENDLVHNVFRLGDRTIGSLMTPRHAVIWLDATVAPATNRARLLQRRASVYPVGNGSLDQVIGTVRLTDLIDGAGHLDPQLARLPELTRDALYLPTTTRAYYALEKLAAASTTHALVVDEFGGVQGLLTLHDLFDELVGDLSASSVPNPAIMHQPDGSYLLDAQLPFAEFLNVFHIQPPADYTAGTFHTVGGFVLHVLHAIPASGQRFTWGGHAFEVVEVQQNRIQQVAFRRAEALAHPIA